MLAPWSICWRMMREKDRKVHELSWLLSTSGGERALCARDAIKGRGYSRRTSPNREAKSSTGLAREWKRRGRIRHLRAKPAGIWAKASKKKRGDREVESTINAWGLLLSGQKATDRNRRVSSPLSPIYYLFLSPSGKLYQKVQHLRGFGGKS